MQDTILLALPVAGVLWLTAAFLLRRKPQRRGWIPAREIIAREATGRHRIERRKGIRMDTCPQCGANVLVVREKRSGDPIVLDAQPDQQNGTVIVLGQTCRFLDGPQDWQAVRDQGFPVYRRHGLHCPGFWAGRREFNHDPEAGTETR